MFGLSGWALFWMGLGGEIDNLGVKIAAPFHRFRRSRIISKYNDSNPFAPAANNLQNTVIYNKHHEGKHYGTPQILEQIISQHKEQYSVIPIICESGEHFRAQWFTKHISDYLDKPKVTLNSKDVNQDNLKNYIALEHVTQRNDTVVALLDTGKPSYKFHNAGEWRTNCLDYYFSRKKPDPNNLYFIVMYHCFNEEQLLAVIDKHRNKHRIQVCVLSSYTDRNHKMAKLCPNTFTIPLYTESNPHLKENEQKFFNQLNRRTLNLTWWSYGVLFYEVNGQQNAYLMDMTWEDDA